MCGIVGILNFSENKNSLSKENLVSMRDSMIHRGPDDCGIYIDRNVGLGHRRLSILDLSPLGRQPMEYKDYLIVFNGEIYNYEDIKKELSALGHKFKSKTDTEVILHAYEEWEDKCLNRFNGMFAFAIYDKKKNEIFIARDRLGVKPLYYFQPQRNLFIFASEIKAICKHKQCKPEINREVLFDFFRYSFVPGKDTLFKNIKELLPGHWIKCKVKSGNLKINFQQYWELPKSKSSLKFKEASEKIESLLRDSIKLRLISDVPVGVQLSGGLDSSLVANYASKDSPSINSVSVDAVESGFSEKKYAQFVSNKLNLKPHNIKLSFSEFHQELDRLLYIYDEPLPHANSIGIYLLSKHAKKHVTVLLSGEGADELFCGYDRYYQLKQYKLISKIPLQRLRFKLAERLLPNCYYNYLVGIQQKPYSDFYIQNVYHSVSREELRGYLNDNIFENKENKYFSTVFEKIEKIDFINRASHFDLKNYLVSLLHRQDRMSMAYSIENRVPFLDYRLVEFVASLTSKYKVRGKITKFILKKIGEKYFPKEFINRPKMGFAVPIEKWLRTKEGDKMLDVLLDNRFKARKIFKHKEIKGLVKKFRSGEKVNFTLIWSILVFEKWARLYFDE